MNKTLIITAALLGAACSDATAPTSTLTPGRSANDVEQSQKAPSVLVTQNPCNGDAVVLQGTLTTIVHANTSTSGNGQSFYSVTGQYTGVGVPSGKNYIGQTQNRETFNTGTPFPIVDEFLAEFTVRSATAIDNFTVRVTFRVTINANGVPTVDNQDISSRCGG